MRRLNTGPCHDFADNAGDFDHPGDGRITTAHARRQLVVSRYVRPAHASALRYVRAARGHRLPAAGLAGHLVCAHPEGNIASRPVPFEPLVKGIVFTRVAAGDCMRPFVSASPARLFTEPRLRLSDDNDGNLTLTIGASRPDQLRPYHGRTFLAADLVGFRAEFPIGPDGDVDELIFHSADRSLRGAASVGGGIVLARSDSADLMR
jgi:hypothetical protein